MSDILKSLAIRRIKEWADTVESLSHHRVVALYDPKEGALLGTMDQSKEKPRKGRKRVRQYFVDFLKHERIQVDLGNPEDWVVVGTVTHFSVALYYNFTFTDRGVTNTVAAKGHFTFVDGKIHLHTSGLVPEIGEKKT